ncbi:MAG: efflux RND transporter permease subunit [Candidatus Hydrogenedentota bacterium]
MKVTNFAIDRSTTVFVSLLLITAMGLYAYFTLPREAMPEITIPYVIVMSMYPGVSPTDMETLVTMPIERQLMGLAGVEKLSSTSGEGASIITVEFDADEPLSDSVQKVRDKVSMARADLPPDMIQEPIVQEANFSDMPVVLVNMRGEVGLAELTELGKDIEERIETLPGVLKVDITGDMEREIQIIVDPVRATNYGTSMSELAQLAIRENVNTPAGSMELGSAKYSLRVPGEISGAEELRDLVVRQNKDGVVYLRDLAEVTDGYKEVQTYSRLNGEPSVTLSVMKRPGANIIEVADQVKTFVAEAQTRIPDGVSLAITADMSKDIRVRVEGLESNILSGLILVVGGLFLFLGITNALFVATAIPISLLITFITMQFLGMSLNNVTLFSLMIALGMLVDNGIVVVENIYRHGQMGKSRVQAAKDGSAEVALPVIASTAVTVAAFFPMMFWPGIMGEFMTYLPKTVIITLFASLFVAIIVNPALGGALARPKPSKRLQDGQTVLAHPALRAYGRFLASALRWRAVTLTVSITSLVVILGVYFSDLKYNFLPRIEPDQANINIEGAEGARLDATDAIAKRIEGIVEPENENLEYLITRVGSQAGSMNRRPGGGGGGVGATTHLGAVTLDFPDAEESSTTPTDIISRIRDDFQDIVGADIRVEESNNMAPPTGAPVHLELSGEEFSVLEKIAAEIRIRMRNIPGLLDLQDNLEKGKPEVRVVVDREKARLAGLDTQFIGMTIQAAINGRKAGEYRVGDDEYDVTVRFPEWFRGNLAYIEGMSIVNSAGQPIPFSSVAKLEEGVGLGSVNRLNGKRVVTIQAEAEGGKGPQVLAAVRQALADLELPPGYSLAYTGENQDMQDTMLFLVIAFFVALVLISLVLVTEFNSIKQTMVIMSSVILSLAGVFLGLLIFDMPFSVMMTGIGCVSLAGVVVNNAIVLIDFANILRDQGKTPEEAIVEAAITRFRPVILGAVTTILGLIPTAVGISFDFRKMGWAVGGASNEYWGPMAVAIVFGLGFATALTLVVVPTLYCMAAGRPKSIQNEVSGLIFASEAIAK